MQFLSQLVTVIVAGHGTVTVVSLVIVVVIVGHDVEGVVPDIEVALLETGTQAVALPKRASIESVTFMLIDLHS